MQLPQFKYNPNAYELDMFTKEKGTCSICDELRNLKYNGTFYSVDEPDYICPYCIADGSASKKYDGDFNDYCGIEGVDFDSNMKYKSEISYILLDKICTQTPSYISWQEPAWLTCCNEPCIFLGYGTEKNLTPLLEELRGDIVKLGYPTETSFTLFIQDLENNIGLGTYLFQCSHCKKHRLHIDFD